MPRHWYRSGDVIVLKPRVLGGAQPEGPGQIVSALPETDGLARYRVRFQSENFERSIGQDDIDAIVAGPRAREAHSIAADNRQSTWIKPNTIRVKK